MIQVISGRRYIILQSSRFSQEDFVQVSHTSQEGLVKLVGGVRKVFVSFYCMRMQ